ncbi:MAG: tetratricopeptide repeat protein [Fermentimonas sp.]|jgi:tetratricopeptide (TPR) repeat protein
MKRVLPLFIVLIFNIITSFGQVSEIRNLIDQGVTQHDQGNYEAAIEAYNDALDIDSTNIEAIYELSLSYLAINDYEKASEYSTKVIDKQDEKLTIGAYAVKSEALAEMGKVDDAIELLKGALEKYGDNYLLHFNLALNYFKKRDNDKAIVHVNKAIDLNKSHSGAFLLNAYLLNDKGHWIKSILSFQMFLLLEPDSKRSKNAFNEMLQTMQIRKSDKTVQRSFIQMQMMKKDAAAKPDDDDTPPLTSVNGLDRHALYQAINNTIDSLQQTDDKNNEYLIFKTVNSTILDELDRQSENNSNGILWTYYVPFFTKIKQSKFYDTYCRYISVGFFPESLQWWDQNLNQAIEFVTWFEEGGE